MKTNNKMGVIIIDIEIKGRNRIKGFFHRLHSKLEDIAFSIIQKLPEKFIPHFLMEWLDRYLDKRITELKQQTIKQTWKNMQLQNYVDNLKNSSR